MTREVIHYDMSIQLRCLRFHGLGTSIGYDLTFFPSKEWPGRVFLMLSADNDHRFFVIASRNALELLHHETPPGIFIDAMIETDDSEWHSEMEWMSIPLARQLIEQLALMEFRPFGKGIFP